jgi:serine protease
VSAKTDLVYRQQQVYGQSIIKTINPSQVAQLTGRDRATVQPNYFYHALFTPNDPAFPLQWDLAAINVPAAWEANGSFFGETRVVVAVLDTGVAYAAVGERLQNPDLATTHIWTNSGDIPNDGIDNDGNGYIDDVNGWNFVGQNNLPLDDYAHGTHIAGIIAAGTNNGLGGAGIAPNVTIMPIKVLDNQGVGSTLTIAQGVDYAVANGATIINLSLGGPDEDPILHQSIINAQAHGVLVVAAAGNENTSQLNYPARYAETISVGATQYDNTRAPYANYGPGLMIMAPGGNLHLDQNGDGQPDGIVQETCDRAACSSFGDYFYSGTSQAAAHVSAVAALLESCGATAGTVQSIITETATDLGAAGRDDVYGYGLINAQAALNQSGCHSTAPSTASNLAIRSSLTGSLLSSTRAWPYKKPYFTWTGPTGATYKIGWGLDGQAPAMTTQTTTSFHPTISRSGTYLLTVTVVDGLGQTSPTTSVRYQYRPPQILITDRKNLYILKNNGSLKSTVKLTASKTAYSASGSTTSINGDGQLILSAGTGGRFDIRLPSGSLVSRLYPFGKKYTNGLTGVIIRRQNMSAIFAVATAQAAEVRWLDDQGQVLKRLIVANGRAKGLRLAAGDIDGDGDDEVAVADARGPAIRLYRADGTLMSTVTPAGKKYVGGWAVTVGDVTGHGQASIIAIRLDARKKPVMYVINGQGRVETSVKLRAPTTTSAYDLATIDLNGDSRDEIVLLADGQSELTTWSRRGKLISTLHPKITLSGARIGRLE